MQNLRVVTLSLLVLVACATPRGEDQFGTWHQQHPDAAKALDAWVKGNPAAAHDIFAWDASHQVEHESADSDPSHDEPTFQLITWAVGAPGQPLDVFLQAHHEWKNFVEIVTKNRVGAEAFVEWCRKYPMAAQDLMDMPLGLSWVAKQAEASR